MAISGQKGVLFKGEGAVLSMNNFRVVLDSPHEAHGRFSPRLAQTRA
jgi:hypothetical protein